MEWKDRLEWHWRGRLYRHRMLELHRWMRCQLEYRKLEWHRWLGLCRRLREHRRLR